MGLDKSNLVQSSFLGGEWSPFAQGRITLAEYKTALNVCRNGFPIEEGAWVRRSGSRYVDSTFGGRQARLIKFDFEQTSPYYMEFSDSALRLFGVATQTGGLTSSLPKDFRVVTTNDNQQVTNVSTANPAAVTTAGATTWVTGEYVVFLFGTITAANQTPLLCHRTFQITKLTGLTFSLTDSVTGATIDGSTLGWSAAAAPAGTIVVARMLGISTVYTGTTWKNLRTVQAETEAIFLHGSFKPYVLNVTTLPTATSFANFSLTAAAFTDGPYLDPPTDSSYLVSSGLAGTVTLTASAITSINNGTGFTATDIGRLIRLFSEPAAWSGGTAYIIGQSVKYQGAYFTCIQANSNQIPDIAIAFWTINTSAAVWTWGHIVSITTPLVCQFAIDGVNLLYAATNIGIWRMGAYSDTTGWPTNGLYYEGRLWLAGAIANRFDASVSNGITAAGLKIDMTPTAGDGTISDANAISYTFNSDDINPILWMRASDYGILCGTLPREWLIKASQLSDPITPTSIQVHPVSSYGCANIEPAHTELTTVFVHRFARKVLECFPDVFSGRYSAPNLSKFGKHLTVAGISEIKYQEELTPNLWVRCADGTLIGAAYKRNTLNSAQGPEFVGWHRHDLGSGRTVESIEVGTSIDGTLDSLAMVTNDAVTGVRHVEILEDIFDVNKAITTGWFQDDAVIPSGGFITTSASGNTLTLNGLWHLNGKTVTVTVGGCDGGDAVVSSGSITVSIDTAIDADFTQTYLSSISNASTYGAKGVSITSGAATYVVPAVVGFTYTSQGQLLRADAPDESRSPTGAGFAKPGRVYQFGAFLQGAQGVSFGTDFSHLHAAQFKSSGGTRALTRLQLFSGIYWDTIEDNFDFDSMIAWQISRPYPCCLTELTGFMVNVDR